MRYVRAITVASLLLFGVLAASGTASASPVISGYTCSGGNVPAGTYSSITVTGVCSMSAGTIEVRGNVTVEPGALLDAVTPGDGLAVAPPPDFPIQLLPSGTPLVPATLLVGGNVTVGAGGVLFLGCSPNISCPQAVTYDRIGGNLTASGALGVVVHSTSIGGNFTVSRGGGGPDVVDGVASGACDVAASAPAPWGNDPSLVGTPVYTDAEDNSVGGNLSITGLQSCWLGALRNRVGGSMTVTDNTMGDPDATEIGTNLVSRDMSCSGNDPKVQYGDGGASPNMVGGAAQGECGFDVFVPSPAPEAMAGPGIYEHISVSAWSLGTSYGLHTQTANIASTTFATTDSGRTLNGALNTVSLTGSGITGSNQQEEVLSTGNTDGSSSFIAYDLCSTCRFHDADGSATIEAYGTTSADGYTSGTFLVITGGAGNGGLSTLAGWGTFSSADEPSGVLRLVEHLKIT